jgi:hypothetical protein
VKHGPATPTERGENRLLGVARWDEMPS